MIWLILGVVIWSALHLFPAVAQGARSRVVKAMGEGPYKGLFALLLVASIALIVVGWIISDSRAVYDPPGWGSGAAKALVLVALVLFVSTVTKTNIKGLVRHPQLSGVLVWAIAHLLANGDSHGLIVFGGMGLWAIVEMAAVSRRDGPWQRPERQSTLRELLPVGVAVVAYALILLVHPIAFGVTP